MASQDAPDEDRYDFGQPSIARVWNAATGGKDNLEPDRDVLDALTKTAPELRVAARAQLEFVTRATNVVAELGIHQWLNLGCGLPPQGCDTTYDTVIRHSRDSRVVYADNDPQVTVHGRALLDVGGTATMVVHADARNVDLVLAAASSVLDFRQRVGLVATALVHFWPDSDDPGGVMRRYQAAFPGGYLIISHARRDLLTDEEYEQMTADYRRTADMYARSLPVIRSMFLDGLDVLEPGLVEASTWRPDDPVLLDVGRAHFLAAVAGFGQYAA
ncbi:SAM-dependent methyltransferase [Nonomuraea sp. NPDC050643]|uniref:SAM-dependent methyltransferase n=1 Tax=Nonomuraea sp. NPDC050643 TaxID=3155660 RepID=UPI0033F27EC3